MHFHCMRNHCRTFSVLALLAFAPCVEAQIVLAEGDSALRRIGRLASDSVYVDLIDGDFAKLSVSHPTGLAVFVVKPDRSLLKSFIPGPTRAGTHPVLFAAEGAGRWAVVLTNTRDTAVQYSIRFTEHRSLDERTRPIAWRDTLKSPTVEKIRRVIESGNSNTTDFWREIQQTGTPIVEPADSRYDLVTFLWRGNNDTRNVFVNASFQIPGGDDHQMHRLGASDVWYLTAKIPKGARFIYQIEPNRPSDPDADRVTRQVDPLNHGEKVDCPPEVSRYRCYSIGELPEAAPQSWLAKREGTPEGTIERKTIHSRIQGVDRNLIVYLPAGYSSKGKPADLLVLFDGDEYLDPDWNGKNTWDNLIAAKRIPPTVVVMVDNLPGRRLFDLVANKEFGDFMADELAPWIRANYNVTREAKRTVIGGASAGGFGAIYLGLVHPEVYGNVLSMSGAIWWSPEHNGGICAGMCATPDGKVQYESRDATTEPNWMASVALKQKSVPAQFFLSAGMFEFDNSGGGGDILEETRRLRDIIRAKNGRVIYQEFVGGHDGLGWRGMLGEGLERLLGTADDRGAVSSGRK